MLLRFGTVLFLLLLCSSPSFADMNVFIYHRFGETRYPSTNISVEVFAQQLAYLKREGFKVLPLSRIAQIVREGLPLPEKSVGLSIDDAFSSFAEQALPLLQQYGFPATLFVNTDSVGKSGYLGWAELQDALTKGIEIGNHTGSHAYLVEMLAGEDLTQWQTRIRTDIERSIKALKSHLGITPEIFAYTYGEYSPAVIALAKEMGFKAAFAQQSGVIYAGSDPWILPRFPMGGPYATLEGFISKLNMQALRVEKSEPVDPVIREQNPPVLRLKLADKEMARGQINCFVQGQNTCQVQRVQGTDDELFVQADSPLAGRRNKYTLTALGRNGQWEWYSHLWINAKRPVPNFVTQP